MENVRNRLEIKVGKEMMTRKFFKNNHNYPSIFEPYKNHDSQTFQQQEVLLDKPFCLGFVVLQLRQSLII